MKKHALALGAAAVGLVSVFWIGAALYQRERGSKLGFLAEQSFSTFVRETSAVLGPADAKVHLIKFSDPACETCAAFAPVVKDLLARHPGKVKLVMRCLPLHPGSEVMCKILEAAKRQGKYWESVDTMYKTQSAWASHHDPQPDRIWELLAAAGVDVATLQRDVNDPVIADLVAQDIADARTLGVTKTPGFFVDGRPLVNFGARELQQLVDDGVRLQYPR